MNRSARDIRTFILIAGDIAMACLALFATLYLRYGNENFDYIWSRHATPFAVVFLIWLAVFYIVGLHDIDALKGRFDLVTRMTEAFAVAFLISLAIFYFVPQFRITPKTNLVIVSLIYAGLFLAWRLAAFHVFTRPAFRSRVVFLGNAPEVATVCDALNTNPHLGYSCLEIVTDLSAPIPDCDIIVVSHWLDDKGDMAPALYRKFFENTTVVDLPTFHEKVHRSIAESALSREWVLSNLAQRELTLSDHLKRPLDAVLAAIMLVPAALLAPFIALAVKLSGPGPVLYRQTRVGLGGKPFTILKFRTMNADAEKDGAVFATEKDPRITAVGNFLRKTRLDELPQLLNILFGEMSFVGPRPERPEFENEIAKTIPLFPVRHLVRPGLTGWAQVNAPYAATNDDHMRKLLLDLYYLKYRRLLLDAAIMLRTIYSVFKRKGR